MLIPTYSMLIRAQKNFYAVGAFNVYNLEGATAVIQAAEELNSPVILQILPSALKISGSSLVALCREAASAASVPVSVHLDHCSDEKVIQMALEAGVCSVMTNGSALPFKENVTFTKNIVRMASLYDADVEGELGAIRGNEDGLSAEKIEERMTRPDEAVRFLEDTGANALAVCIGNRHGKYHHLPNLDFERLAEIEDRVMAPLVLHGASGLSQPLIISAIGLGITKFNVNTEIRSAYLSKIKEFTQQSPAPELVDLMQAGIDAMVPQVKLKMRLFGSVNKAKEYFNHDASYFNLN